MNAAQVISLEDEIAARLASRFERESGADWAPGLLHERVRSGYYQMRIIGRVLPQYAVWFYVQADNKLYVGAMLSLSIENRLADAAQLVDELAGLNGCHGAVFQTNRRGLARYSQRHGYKESAVVMEK